VGEAWKLLELSGVIQCGMIPYCIFAHINLYKNAIENDHNALKIIFKKFIIFSATGTIAK